MVAGAWIPGRAGGSPGNLSRTPEPARLRFGAECSRPLVAHDPRYSRSTVGVPVGSLIEAEEGANDQLLLDD